MKLLKPVKLEYGVDARGVNFWLKEILVDGANWMPCSCVDFAAPELKNLSRAAIRDSLEHSAYASEP